MACQPNSDILKGFRKELEALRSVVQEQKATNDKLLAKCDRQDLYIDILMKDAASHETKINELSTHQSKSECRHLQQADQNECQSNGDLHRQTETQAIAIKTLRDHAITQSNALTLIRMHQQDCTRLHAESAKKHDRQSDINDELLALHNAHSTKLDRQSDINIELHALHNAHSARLTELSLSNKSPRDYDMHFQELLTQQQNHAAILSDLESKHVVATSQSRRLRADVKAAQGELRTLRPVQADLKAARGEIRALWPLLELYGDLRGMIENHRSDIEEVNSEVRDLNNGLKGMVEGGRGSDIKDLGGELRKEIKTLGSDLKEDIENLCSDIRNLSSDVVEDINGLRSDIDGLHSDVEGLDSDTKGLSSDVEESSRALAEQGRINDQVREWHASDSLYLLAIGDLQALHAEAWDALGARLGREDRQA